MKSLNTECIGMDIGDTSCVIRGVDEVEGAITVVRKGRVESCPDRLRDYFKPIAPTRVIIEASTHSPWISRLITELGHDVFVVNPHRVQLISQNKYKDDETDAELLARLGRADVELMCPIEHREENCQADLVNIRMRATLVDARTSLISAVRGVVKSFGGRIPSCSSEAFGKKAGEYVPEMIRDTLEMMLAEIRQLTLTIKALDKNIALLSKERYPETERLLQIKGVGPVTALCFVLICQSPERFSSNRAVGAYLGLCPGRKQSGERDPDCRITKAGDSYARQLLVQCGHYILNFGEASDLKSHGAKLIERGGKYARQKAAVAVARKLSVLLMSLWRTGKIWDPLYNAKRTGKRVYKLEDRQKTAACMQ